MENPRPVLVHGHRGARAVCPENTLAGFEYAIASGVDAIEMDVAVTLDDVPVISHDPYLPGGAYIRELPFADLRRAAPAVPTLDETLALAPKGAFLFNIELKSYPRRPRRAPPPTLFAELVLDAIRRAHVERRTLIQSFDFRVLHAFESLAPAILRSALFQRLTADFVSVAGRARTPMVSPHHRFVTPRKVGRARDAGIGVIAWTANRPRDWRRLTDAGVAAIITDDPAALIQWLSERSPA